MDKNFDKNFGWPFEENSRATISCVPKHLVNTPLLRDRYFFTLPKMLLDEISKNVGKSDGKHPKHLKEWMQIVRCGNTARNRLDSLVRRLELQHYWRVFCVRHADVVTGNINRLEKAFATFLALEIPDDIDIAARDGPVGVARRYHCFGNPRSHERVRFPTGNHLKKRPNHVMISWCKREMSEGRRVARITLRIV